MTAALYILAGLLWAMTQVLTTNKVADSSNKYLAPPPEKIEYFHFGFRESIADSLWLRWIQDSDYCQTYIRPVEYLDASEQAKVVNDLVTVPRHKVCDMSWSFKMLDAVTRLSPRFWMPYLAGASTLAILVEDYEGASEIYRRGLKEYPKDWQLLYRAAFHFQFNDRNLPLAAELLNRAADSGAPYWVRSLASRLFTESGQLELALSTLIDYRKIMEKNPEALERIDKRIAEIQSKLKK